MKRLILYLTLLGQVAYSQPTYFNIQFDHDSIWEGTPDIVETDSFYVAVGIIGSWTNSDTGFVLRLSKSGVVSGYHKFNFYPGSKAWGVLRSPSGGNVIDIHGNHHDGLGTVENTDLFLCRMDVSSFDTLILKSFGKQEVGDFSSNPMFRTTDNQVVLTGYQFANNNNEGQRLLLLKCDSNLNEVFLQTHYMNLADIHFGSGVAETSDKGYLVVGSREFNQFDAQGSYLRVDSLGNLLWWKDLAPQGNEEWIVLNNIVQLSDKTYLVNGHKQIFVSGNPRYELHLLYGLNEQGDILWEKVYGDSTMRDVYWRSLVPLPDGNFLAGGAERTNGFPPEQKQYGTLAKISPIGDVLWERRYTVSTENKLYDIFYKAIPTSDGGIIAAGSTWGDSITRENSWIVKLDSFGCMEPGCDMVTDVIELPVGENSPIKIYPIPTGGQVTVETQSGKRIKSLKVYDLQGRIILSHSYQNQGEASLRFDLSGEPPGIYFLTALIGEVWVTRQVLLQ